MKIVKGTVMGLALTFLLTVPAQAACGGGQATSCTAQVKSGIPQTICPVMGGKVNRDIFLDYEGNRIYFCCQSCKDTFLSDPAPYLEKMKKEGVVLEKSPGN